MLYGLYQAKEAIRKAENAYLVEGYTDVLAMHQAGVKQVVASSGTALTAQQAKLLKRYTPKVTLLYDADSAGVNAALRGIKILLQAGLEVQVALLPGSADPDSYIKSQGAAAFKAELEKSTQDFVLFQSKVLLADVEQSPLKRAEAARSVLENIAAIPDALKREVYMQLVARTFELNPDTLETELAVQQEQLNRQPAPPLTTAELQTQEWLALPENHALEESLQAFEEEAESVGDLYHQEQELMRLLLLYSDHTDSKGVRLSQLILDELNEIPLQTPVFQQMLEQVLHQPKALKLAYWQEQPDPLLLDEAIKIFTNNSHLSSQWELRFGILTPPPAERLDFALFRATLYRKFRYLDLLLEQVLSQLDNDSSSSGQIKSQKLYLAVKREQQSIGNELSIIIH